MGFLNRLLRVANKVDDVKTGLEYNAFRDRRYDRAEDLMARGSQIEGVVTGVHFRYTNDSTEGAYRVEWHGPTLQAAGVLFLGKVPPSIRYGASVPLRVADDKAIVDGPALSAHGVGPAECGLPLRKPPDAGLSDTSLNSDVLRHLASWPRETATVHTLEPVTVLGLSTQNLHVSLELADGAVVVVKRAFVPPYVRHVMAPGLSVPIGVHPQDRTRAVIDWCALAAETAGGAWGDLPVEGSVADLDVSRASDLEQTMSSSPEPGDLRPPEGATDPIEGVSIETVALIDVTLQTARVPPAEYDAWATETFGVPAGRWRAIRDEWDLRIRADWRVGMVYGEATTAAVKEVKRRKKERRR